MPVPFYHVVKAEEQGCNEGWDDDCCCGGEKEFPLVNLPEKPVERVGVFVAPGAVLVIDVVRVVLQQMQHNM